MARLHRLARCLPPATLTPCRLLASATSSRRKPPRRISWLPNDNKSLADFLPGYQRPPMRPGRAPPAALSVETAAAPVPGTDGRIAGDGLTFAIETRGCQMNVADSEVVRSLLVSHGFKEAVSLDDAKIVLVNTCAIRERAEAKVWQFLYQRRAADSKRGQKRRVYALLGCMAERLRESILEHPDRLVDVVAGPDAYRDLPLLLSAVANGDSGAVGYNIQLSVDETYSDISPMRSNPESRSAFVSIARSCPMSCSFCIVPHVRGPERSRPMDSIISEARSLVDQGVKEITLLGQNVNSWRIRADGDDALEATAISLSRGFGLPGVLRPKASLRFSDLLSKIAAIDPEVRVRFTSPHPAHFPEDLLDVMRETPNICNSLHLPLQSGSTDVLHRMRRRYTADAYRELVGTIRERIPGVRLSTDIIVGFCGETESEHEETLRMFRDVRYDQAFMYAYSERAKTEAARIMNDDVPEVVKQRRLREVIDLFHELALLRNKEMIGTEHLVLVEDGKGRPPAQWRLTDEVGTGRTDGNKRVIFRDVPVSNNCDDGALLKAAAGDYIAVTVVDATSVTLVCEPLYRTTLTSYSRNVQDTAKRTWPTTA